MPVVARKVEHTAAFLRLAAIELRKLTDQDHPSLTKELREIADQLDAQARDLVRLSRE